MDTADQDDSEEACAFILSMDHSEETFTVGGLNRPTVTQILIRYNIF